MSSFGSQMRKRVEELRKAGANVQEILYKTARAATSEAVKTATANTPPNGVKIAGTKTRTGELAGSWAKDSIIEPQKVGLSFVSELKNNMQYASYVNDGHRVDQHYVPGLVKNGDMLEMANPADGGLVVGTKTTYVKGLYMKEKGIGKYRSTVRKILEREVARALQ